VLAEPIAIIGAAVRYPGGVDDLDTFWKLLEDEREALEPIPASRWSEQEWYDPEPGTPGRTYVRTGGFLHGIEDFDPLHFGVAPREATRMDPRQRLLLELGWEALEDAGIAPSAARGTATGVYVGMMAEEGSSRLSDPRDIDTHSVSGSGMAVAAGRLAFALGLQGPTFGIDAACASSLVAIHLASQSLRTGESDLALAGGVNLMLSPLPTVAQSASRMLSVAGHCRSFDADADGFVRSEGAGLLVLRRLSDAIARGDRILALIRGSAVNHGGRTSALTVPNGTALGRAMSDALRMGGVSADTVDYVEAHGTGTPLGDPIELEAVARTYAGSPRSPVGVGSVKTNIGHTEAAAGVASMLKAALALSREHIPAHLHLRRPNPNVRWDSLRLRVVTKAQPWPRTSTPRRAGVTAFGFNGTNAHLVLEESPDLSTPSTAPPGPWLLLLSARTPEALRVLADRYATLLAHEAPPLGDLAWSAAAGRSALDTRLALVLSSVPQARATLAGAARGEGWRPTGASELETLGQAWVDGDAGALPTIAGRGGRKIYIPLTPFHRQRYWVDPPTPAPERALPIDLDALEALSDDQAQALLAALAAGKTRT